MALMAAGVSAQQQDCLSLSSDKNIMDAAVGDEVTYTISLVHNSDSLYAAFSCDLWLPEGVEIVKTKVGRLSYFFVPVSGSDFDTSFGLFNYSEGQRSEAERYGNDGMFYRLIAKTDNPVEIYFPYDEEALDLFTFKVKKTADFEGDVCPIYLRLVEFAAQIAYVENRGEDNEVIHLDKNDNDEVVVTTHIFPNTKSIALKINDSKFGTLCIDDDLDFSDSELTANVCSGTDDGYVQVTPVEKPAAKTPLIIKGEAGSYFLKANYGETSAEVSNLLLGTPNEALTVSGSNTYAMASKEKDGANVVGFYRVQEGVEIPRYKAYINSSEGVDGFIFEETTGIRTVQENTISNDVYSITGSKVNNATQKGVYIMNGKKVVVK